MTMPGSQMLPVIDGYAIERELGGGGMSRVFLATEVALNRRVVVKVLGRELAQGLSADRFAREIALAAQLQDPHIVPVHAAGTTGDGVPFFTMPYVEGESLRERLLRGAVPLDETLRILRDVAEALEYAHARGIVHRDIKPANILLSGRGAVVADFGIAKAITAARGGDAGSASRDASATLTSAGTSLGTPAYMAPEQAVGDTTDHRADLYAWGMVAYELLAGGHPFASRTSSAQLVAAQLSEMPRALDEVRPGLPPTLGALVMQCLAKSPDARPASATALLGQLGTVGTAAGDISGARPFMRANQRPAWQRFTAIAAVVLFVAAGAFALFSRQAPAESPADERTLAVLPFEHQGDSTESYLTDGVTDEIRSRLARVPGMSVIARGSVMPYRGSTRTPREIAEELGVRYLMTGTVRVIGTGDTRRVLVRPELVEITPDGQARSKWGEAIELPISDVVRVQGEVAGRVAAALEVEVAPTDRARITEVSTTDPAAYDAYLRGQAITNWGSDSRPTTSARAIPFFEEAVRRDSMLVDAWAALARARVLLYTNGREQSSALEVAARAAVERTMTLAPTSALGLLTRSSYRRLVSGDLDGARADLEAAVRADPSDFRSRANLGYLLEQQVDRPAEALPHLDRAAALDPRASQVHQARAIALAMLGRYEDARRAADRALALAPSIWGTVQVRILIDVAEGDIPAAQMTVARLIGSTSDPTLLLAMSNAVGFLMDSPTISRALSVRADQYDGDRGEWATAIAYTYFIRGDTVNARAWGDSAIRILSAERRKESANRAVIDFAFAQALAGYETSAAATANQTVVRLRAEVPSRMGMTYRSQLMNAANVAAIAGARDSAIAWLTEVRQRPSLFSPPLLRIDPIFASLRNDPRFEALLAPQPWETNRR